MNKFKFLKAFNSPFKRPELKLYIGEISLGTPYFYPRRWVKGKDGSRHAVPKKIGFDFVGLGWKSKWEDTDYRFEWGPVWSFVFFKWQIALTFKVPYLDDYWTAWLYYERDTDHKLDKKSRVLECRKNFKLNYTSHYGNGVTESYDAYEKILKEKFL